MLSAYSIPGIRTTTEVVERAAVEAWENPLEDLYKRSRKPKYAWPRFATWFYLHQIQKQSEYSIARQIPFDRASILHAVKKVRIFIETNDCEFMPRYHQFLKLLR